MLQVKDLHSGYGRITVLHGVSLDVAQGEIVTLIGSNGAGKTTLLRAISGVQPITAGTVTFNGTSIEQMSASERVILGLAQSPEGRQVFGPLSVDENLRLGAFLRKDNEIEQDRKKIYGMFPILEEKRHLSAGILSGGQQQMLAIGRALMARPKLLLLDEPSLGLSPILIRQIFDVIVQLRDAGVTILVVEQNATMALSIADRGYVIETGHIVHSGNSLDLLNDPETYKAYLG